MEPTAHPSAAPGRERPHGIPLGRILGFPVRMRWSVLILIGLVTLLPGRVIGYAVGFGFGVSLLASLLLHELGHALTARWLRIGVRGITLEILGGYTELTRDSPSPRAELLVSLAGPLVSFGGGLAGLATAVVLPDGVIQQVAVLVALANLVVAAFNVLPGLPLDGGRALRALVWWISGDRHTGTLVAARTGQGLAVLAGLGALVLYLNRYLTVLGLVLLGLVAVSMWHGALVAWRSARLHRRLPRLDLDRLTRPIFVVPTGTPLAEAQRQAAVVPGAVLGVADQYGRLRAVVHARAARCGAEAPPALGDRGPGGPDLTSIRALPAGLSGAEALGALQADPAGEYLVTRQDQVVGVLHTADVARVLRGE